MEEDYEERGADWRSGADSGGACGDCDYSERFGSGGAGVFAGVGWGAGGFTGCVGGGAGRAEVLSVEDAAASAVVAAAWAGESVSSGESFGGAAGGAGYGRDADYDGVPGAAGCGVGAAYFGGAGSAECVSHRYYERRGGRGPNVVAVAEQGTA